MTEHVCKWIEGIDREFLCEDVDCDAYLIMPQAARRLNEYETLKKATDVLSAEDVRLLYQDVYDLIVLNENLRSMMCVDAQNKLLAYADILEGKDETRS